MAEIHVPAINCLFHHCMFAANPAGGDVCLALIILNPLKIAFVNSWHFYPVEKTLSLPP
jgi:hypothetical protein